MMTLLSVSLCKLHKRQFDLPLNFLQNKSVNINGDFHNMSCIQIKTGKWGPVLACILTSCLIPERRFHFCPVRRGFRMYQDTK